MSPVRTLFLMPNCEFPPKEGTPQGVWRNMVALSKLGPIAVFSVGVNENPDSTIPGVERWVHVDKPLIQQRSALRTIYERIRRIFIPNEYPYCHVRIEKEADRQLRRLIDEFEPTLAVLDHWLNAVIPSALHGRDFPVVVASHDVEWQLSLDLVRESLKTASLLRRLRNLAENAYVRNAERRLYAEAARTWAVSERDRIAIQRFTGLTSEVRVLPAVIELGKYEAVRNKNLSQTPRTKSAPTLLYAGGYHWEPNREAAHILIADVYPALQAVYPGTRLVLIGRMPSPEMDAAAQADDNIVVTGQVEDVKPYLAQADVIPVPLRIGGGMRVKILEAFAAGVPVVSTTKGCEGIAVTDGRELLIRDDISEFVAAIKQLWEDPDRAVALAGRAFEFVQREHSMDLLEARVREEVQDVLEPTALDVRA